MEKEGSWLDEASEPKGRPKEKTDWRRRRRIMQVLLHADHQADSRDGSATCPLTAEGGALCAAVLGEPMRFHPAEHDALCIADIAARTERLLEPTALQLALSRAHGRGQDELSQSWLREWRKAQGWTEPISTPTALHDPHCQRLMDVAHTLGCEIDKSRVLCTNKDGRYRSFVEWQTRWLKDQGCIGQRARPALFLRKEGALHPAGWCTGDSSHQAAEEYIALRQQIVTSVDRLPTKLSACLSTQGKDRVLLYIVSICRKEDAYIIHRQTRCLVNPDDELGIYLINAHGKKSYDGKQTYGIQKRISQHAEAGWVLVCSEEMAMNMAYQGFPFVLDLDEDSCKEALSSSDDTAASLNLKEKRLLRMTTLHGRELCGLSVQCKVGDTRRIVPLEMTQTRCRKGHILVDSEISEIHSADPKLCEKYSKIPDLDHIHEALALPEAFSYMACTSDFQLTIAGNEPVVVALVDSYFIQIKTEWQKEARRLIESMYSNRGDKRGKGEFVSLLKQNEWFISRPTGSGIPLPWSQQAVLSPCFEQALLLVYLAVVPFLPDGTLTDEDWDRILQPRGRERLWAPNNAREECLAKAQCAFQSCYPPRVLVVPAHSRWAGCNQSHSPTLFISFILHIALWGSDLCPKIIQFSCIERSFSAAAYRWHYRTGERPDKSHVTLSKYGSSLSRMVRATGSKFHTDEDFHFVRARRVPSFPVMPLLHRIYMLARGFFAHSSRMRPHCSAQRILILSSHLRDPESAFARLPLELVLLILQHTCTYDITHMAIQDCIFSKTLHAHFTQLASALHSHQPKLAVDVISCRLLPSIKRYRLAVGGFTMCNRRLLRTLCKIMAASLSPMCPNFSALLWRSFIARDRSSRFEDIDLQQELDLPQDQPAINSALEAMSRWWRKRVTRSRKEGGGLGFTERANFSPVVVRSMSMASDATTERASYLERLTARIVKSRRTYAPASPENCDLSDVHVDVTVATGIPEWASVVTRLLDRHSISDSGASKDSARQLLEEVRSDVLQDDNLRPHIREIMNIATLLQEWDQKGELTRNIRPSFSETSFIRRFAGHIAKSAGVAYVHVLEHRPCADVSSPELFCIPGHPLIEVRRVKNAG